MKAIILAASPDAFGRELHASLWPVLGRPLIDHQLEALAALGAREAWVCLRHRPFALDAHLQGRTRLGQANGIQAKIQLEGHEVDLLSTLKRAERFVTTTTLLLPADLLPPCELGAYVSAHRESGAWLTEVRDAEGHACYVLEPAMLSVLAAAGPLDVYRLALAGHPVRRVAHAGLTCLGTPASYLAAQAQRLEGRYVDATAQVHPAARLSERVWIGPHCWVGRDAKLGDGTVLLEGARVERGADLQAVVVLPRVRVGPAAKYRHAVLSAEGTFLAEADGVFVSEPDPAVLGSTARRGFGEALHQGLDMVLAGLALFVLAPLLLLLALLIRLDSKGPIFYSQLRVGQDRRGSLRGRVFALYKFRTMHHDAEARLAELSARNSYRSGPFFKLDDDPRITRLGRFLRKSSLDELPQLINVLLGDMRLVGNRPLPVYEAEALSEEWQRLRFSCPAGITGLWQISGRSDLSEVERMVLDTVYAVTRSFWSDWGILLGTLPALLLRRGAR